MHFLVTRGAHFNYDMHLTYNMKFGWVYAIQFGYDTHLTTIHNLMTICDLVKFMRFSHDMCFWYDTQFCQIYALFNYNNTHMIEVQFSYDVHSSIMILSNNPHTYVSYIWYDYQYDWLSFKRIKTNHKCSHFKLLSKVVAKETCIHMSLTHVCPPKSWFTAS
jgi:hypothetical protein